MLGFSLNLKPSPVPGKTRSDIPDAGRHSRVPNVGFTPPARPLPYAKNGLNRDIGNVPSAIGNSPWEGYITGRPPHSTGSGFYDLNPKRGRETDAGEAPTANFPLARRPRQIFLPTEGGKGRGQLRLFGL